MGDRSEVPGPADIHFFVSQDEIEDVPRSADAQLASELGSLPESISGVYLLVVLGSECY